MYTRIERLRSVEVNIVLRERDNDPCLVKLVVYRFVKLAGGMHAVVYRPDKKTQHNR